MIDTAKISSVAAKSLFPAPPISVLDGWEAWQAYWQTFASTPRGPNGEIGHPSVGFVETPEDMGHWLAAVTAAAKDNAFHQSLHAPASLRDWINSVSVNLSPASDFQPLQSFVSEDPAAVYGAGVVPDFEALSGYEIEHNLGGGPLPPVAMNRASGGGVTVSTGTILGLALLAFAAYYAQQRGWL